MDTGAWKSTVHRVPKTQLKQLHIHEHLYACECARTHTHSYIVFCLMMTMLFNQELSSKLSFETEDQIYYLKKNLLLKQAALPQVTLSSTKQCSHVY